MDLKVQWSHQARFAPAPGSAAAARIFVTRYLLKHDLAYLVDDIRLVASELVTNASVHAQTPALVTLEARPARVRLSVHDSDPVVPRQRGARRGDVTGRGLRVVERFSTDWGAARAPEGGKIVWAEFALRTTL
jgi:anti-sigma regulatory factor (Ser/Thr protein kinase)